MKFAKKLQLLLFGAGFALCSGLVFSPPATAKLPIPDLAATWMMLEGESYPIVRALPIILNRTGGGSYGDFITTDRSADGRYELVELIGGMSSESIFSYSARTAFRKARVKDNLTGQVIEVLIPLIVRYL